MRIAGHALRYEGWAFLAPKQRADDVNATGPGMALCECGTYSPILRNKRQRQLWHRDVHKPAVLMEAIDGQ